MRFDDLAAVMRDGERTLAVSRAALREETLSNSTIRSADKLCGTDGSTVGQRVTAHGRAPLDRQGLRETLVRSRRHVHSHCTGRRANDPQVHRLANHLPYPLSIGARSTAWSAAGGWRSSWCSTWRCSCSS